MYVEQVEEFKKHLDESSNEMVDLIGQGKEYDGMYDIVIVVKDKLLRVPMNADSFSRLQSFLDAEIEEDLELNTNRG